MRALLLAFGITFVAEIGDKSQVVAMVLAARYSIRAVLSGLAIGAGSVLGLAVVLGDVLRVTIPRRPAALVAGISFLAFAVWTLWDARRRSGEQKPSRSPAFRSSVATVAAAVFLAELGDKTMLATAALATREGPVGTWIGATSGLVMADALVLWIGRLMGARLPERVLRIAAAVAFATVGILLIVRASI